MGIFDSLKDKHKVVKKTLGEQIKAVIKPSPVTGSSNDTRKLESQTQSSCPYCESPLKDVPKKKKKCPTCGNYIYVRTKQNLFPSILLREEDALAADEFEKLKAHGVSQRNFTSEKNRLSKEKKADVSSIDVCLNLYNKLILQTKDPNLLRSLYFEMALFLYSINRDFFNHLQMSAKMELMAYKQQGVRSVSILTCGEASCSECKKLSDRVYTIDKALRENPVPCKACSFRLHGGRAGWCRCQYITHK